MKGRFLGVLAFMAILLLSLLALTYNYREDACFSSPSCMLNRMDAERGLVVVYHKEGEWKVITYENGALSEIIATLKRNLIVKRINVEKRQVKTGLNYSPVSFSIDDIPAHQDETAMIIKIDGKVRVLKGEEIKKILNQTWNFRDILKKFNGVRFIFVDRAKEPSIDGNPLVGGYLVMPSPSKCTYSTWVVAFENRGNDTLLALYPTWNVSGRVGNLSGPTINVTKIPENLTIPCSGQEILINASEIIINPFPTKLLDESNLRCPVVEKTTIHFNGTTKTLRYTKKCVVSGG